MKITYTNERGQSVIFGYSPPFVLSSFEGLGGVEVDIQRQKSPYQDGSTFIDNLLEDRALPLGFTIKSRNHNELNDLRRYLSTVCNPKLRGQITYENNDLVRVIDVECESSPYFPSGNARTRNVQEGTIDFIALNPYWKSPTIEEEPMAAFVELFEFPSDYWELGDDGDIYFEMGTEGHTRTFINNGDSPVPIKITIKGPTLNPTLTNLSTGELIKINRELSADDVLEISTEDGNKYILLNGEDAFQIDLQSTFWKMQVGRNEIQYTADAGQESATLEIYWQEQFVGV